MGGILTYARNVKIRMNGAMKALIIDNGLSRYFNVIREYIWHCYIDRPCVVLTMRLQNILSSIVIRVFVNANIRAFMNIA